MNLGQTAPAAGQPVSSTLIHELIREVRANRPLPGPGVRVQRTPNGSHISAVAGSAKNGKSVKINGCFALRPKEKENPEDDDEYEYANPYYRVGGKTYKAGSGDAMPAGSINENTFVALRVDLTGSSPGAQLETYASFADLNEAENDLDFITIPLYKFGNKKEGDKIAPIECDFRIGVPAINSEFGEVTV